MILAILQRYPKFETAFTIESTYCLCSVFIGAYPDSSLVFPPAEPAAAAASSAAAAAVPSYSFDNTGFTTAAHTVVQDNILLQGASNTLTFQPTIQAGLQQQTLQEQQMDPNMGQVLSFLNDDIMMVETNDPMENFSGISLPSGFSSGIMGELGDLVGAEETVQPAPAADLNPSSWPGQAL